MLYPSYSEDFKDLEDLEDNENDFLEERLKNYRHNKAWRYEKNLKHKRRDLKLASYMGYSNSFWIHRVIENGQIKGVYIRQGGRSRTRSFAKKQTSHQIRKAKCIKNGNNYRKFFDFWWYIY